MSARLGEDSSLADHEAFPSPFPNCLRHLLQRVDFENSLHLSEETIQQAKIATRIPDDRRDRFRVQRPLGKIHAGGALSRSSS